MLEIGDSLLEARERQRLSYADVEAATLIPARYLEAIEAEDFDRLPDGLYRRSFLREYADFVGLDGKAYAEELALRDNPEPAPAPVVAASTVSRRRWTAPSLAWASLVVGVLLLAGIAVWRLTGGSGGAHSASPPPETTTPPATTTARRPTTTAPAPPPKPPATLVVRAVRGDCWVSVRIAATGKTVFEQTLAQGGTLRFGLKRPLLLRFGAPSNVTATIGGRDVGASLLGTATDVLATPHGLRPPA